MGFFDSLRDVASVGLAPLTGGASLLGGSEDFRSRLPLVGGLTGAQSDAQKALLAKQKQMAEEAKKRQRINEQARMNALGQKILAFNPQNQMMAQMFGPEAAFSPQQFAQMAQNPMPQQAWGTGTDEERINQVKDRDAERARQSMIMNNMRPLPGGPAPLDPRTPQAARRRG